MKLLKNLKLREFLMIIACLALIVFQVWLDLKLPDYMSEITMLVQTAGSSMSDIWRAGGKMLLCALGSLAGAVASSFFAANIAASFARNLRNQIYDKVESFSMEEIGKFSTASLITRSTNDITQVQMLFAIGLQMLLKAPITAVWAITKIAGKSWQWSAATGCSIAALVVIISIVLVLVYPRFKIVQRQTDALNSVTRENLTGVRVVRAYNAEQYQEEKFNKANTDLTGTQLFNGRVMAIMQPGMSLIMNGLVLAIYWIGAFIIDSAALTEKAVIFSDMVVYSSYAMQVVMSFMMLIAIFFFLPRAIVSAGRIQEVLSTTSKILDGDLDNMPWTMGEVEFKNVSFKYPDADEYVLEDVSFKASSGETVAFIGSTGSGKSTLINLIPRFYDATEGQVLIDGKDIREYRLRDLRRKIGYVPQKSVLFRGTIKSNIAFGDNSSEKDVDSSVTDSISIAQGAEFVETLPQKYEAPVAQNGTNFSGGQKQRLSIARAIMRKPEIFVFDDSFSALDYKTDHELRHQLGQQTSGATTFIVAQRIGTIRNADKIVVLDEGRVCGIGTHDELMQNCGVYQEIAYSQLSKEELGA